jgi:hypothetical protein
MAQGLSYLELAGIVLAAVTAAGVFFGPYLAEKVRQRHERQRERLEQFRRDVLGQIRALLEEHYLPILRNERPSVGVFTESLPRKEAHLLDRAGALHEEILRLTL